MARAALVFGTFVVLVILAADFGWAESLFALLQPIPQRDKIGHVLLMGGLGFFVGGAAGRLGPGWAWGSLVVLAFLVSLEEFTQIWLPRRSFDPLDLVCSLVGVGFFGVLGVRRELRAL